VKEASDDWQFVASIKGRSGAPCLSSGWQAGAQTIEFDVAQKLRELGYDLNYAELHFAIGLWPKAVESPAQIEFSATLLAQPAVVGCLPVIRTAEHAKEGLPVSAVVTDGGGKRLGAGEVSLFATAEGQRVSLRETDGVWTGTIKDLPIGDHLVDLAAEPNSGTTTSAMEKTKVFTRITDGAFCKYDREKNAIHLNGKPVKPLTGSFQGPFFYRDVGLSSERLVKTQADWDNWDRSEPPGEHMHYWESLKPAELADRFDYLAENKWDLVHLHSHYGIWERFDAFGHPAPHGVEQFAAYVRAASQAGIRVMVTLSSYPYSVDTHNWDEGTTPYAQTLENGFKNEDWYKPAHEPFNSQYRRYVKSFVSLFRDETGIFSFSSSGEGDWKNGPERFLDTQEAIRSVDREHLIVSEPVLSLNMLPAKQVAPYPSDLVGDRNYGLGGAIPFEQDLGILFRLNRMVPNMYLAEGSFPSSHLYTRITGNGNPYVGTPEYRLHVRDTFYLGLVHRMPVMMTWDEVFTEDEHRILAEVREHFDWTQPPEEPAVAVIVGDDEAKGDGHAKLGELEAGFTRLPLDYRFIADPKEARSGETVIDARKPYEMKAFSSVSNLPEALRERVPFSLSPGWSASYCRTRDRKGMLAYIYNTMDQTNTSFYLGAAKQRAPKPADLRIGFLNAPTAAFTLYDLETKKAERKGTAAPDQSLTLPSTSHDFLLLLEPK